MQTEAMEYFHNYSPLVVTVTSVRILLIAATNEYCVCWTLIIHFSTKNSSKRFIRISHLAFIFQMLLKVLNLYVNLSDLSIV